MYSKTLRNVFARYADCMLAQIFQSTACNAIHSIEQRTAKWIISAMERTDGDDIVPLTHEQLATLLGVGRSYTSRVIQTFKAEGMLETRRGSILVRDREALQARACLCNESVKDHFEEVLRGVYPTDGRAADRLTLREAATGISRAGKLPHAAEQNPATIDHRHETGRPFTPFSTSRPGSPPALPSGGCRGVAA